MNISAEYESILEDIRVAKIVYVDETGEKVDGKKHWLWVFTTKTQALFVISKSRGKNVLEQVLGKDFEGYMGCDGWKSLLISLIGFSVVGLIFCGRRSG